MKIYIGTDHAGFELKEEIVSFLKEQGYEVEDKGAEKLNLEDDYPDFILPVAKAVAAEENSRGIILGSSGQGEALAANKIKGVRAVVYYGGSPEIIRLSREHNDANVLSLGAHFLDVNDAKEMINLWLSTRFSEEERHVRRLRKISEV